MVACAGRSALPFLFAGINLRCGVGFWSWSVSSYIFHDGIARDYGNLKFYQHTLFKLIAVLFMVCGAQAFVID